MAQFAEMSRMIREIPKKVRMGTLKRIEEGLLIASGLDQHVGVGDLCMIEGGTRAEITAVSPGEIRLIPFGSVAELSPGLLIWKEASGICWIPKISSPSMTTPSPAEPFSWLLGWNFSR
jgi:flagellar biosynthesis/type III secretory pathway ATPase